MALIAYVVWPTWEGGLAREKFPPDSSICMPQDAYRAAPTARGSEPGRPARLRALQVAARRARSDAEASTARLADEPAHAALPSAVAEAMIAAVGRLAMPSSRCTRSSR